MKWSICEKVDLNHYDDPKAKYSNDMLDTYNNIEEYKLRKKGFHEDGLIVFHDMVADMINNKS